ncbi:mechanosensitive ion channel [Candidatus Gracilibacteria bacterium]|nr:mechanosensitive ion channel [Candidatus Gracilibacteria bacterium]
MENISQYLPNNFVDLLIQFSMAIVILIIGFIVAKLVSSVVAKGVSKLTFVEDMFAQIGASINIKTVASWIKTGVFLIILLFVLAAFFDALNLVSISQPINDILNSLPRYLGVLALAIFTWIAANVGKYFTTRGLAQTDLDLKAGTGTSSTIGTAVYGFIILFFLPGILGGLGLQEIVTPIEGILNQMVGYVPNIIGAGIILAVGVFVARLVKQIVSSILNASKIDAMAAKVGVKNVSLANIGGTLVYVFIMIPLAISALDKLGIETISGPAKEILAEILAILPDLIGAIALVGITYIVANFASKLVGDLLKSMGFDNILSQVGVQLNLKSSLSQIASKLILVVSMLFAFVEAGNMLGLTIVSDMVEQFLEFGGAVLGGAITIFIGMIVANMVATAMRSASNSKAVVSFVRIAIIILSVAIGLGQMGIADDIINLAFGLTFGAIAVAAALSIGLGARDVAGREVDQMIQKMKK